MNVAGAAPSPRLFLTVQEVAAMLGIATRSVYERLSRGDLAFHRVGRLVRIRAADVAEYLDRSRVEANPSHYGRLPPS